MSALVRQDECIRSSSPFSSRHQESLQSHHQGITVQSVLNIVFRKKGRTLNCVTDNPTHEDGQAVRAVSHPHSLMVFFHLKLTEGKGRSAVA